MAIDVFAFAGYPVAVLGLGKSGLSAARALMASGAEVSAWDDDPARRAEAEAVGVPISDFSGVDWREMTTLVISPGIPHTHPEPHPVAEAARAGGCEIIGDIELLARSQRDANFVGITGTNGKSTTTVLVGHVLETAGRDAAVGGNLGIPALELRALGEGEIYVLEMSSYQLELTFSVTFDVAVLLNISEDHLERHGGLEGYIAAKRQIFHRQTKPRTAVIGVDDPICRGIWEDLKATGDQVVVPIATGEKVHGGVYVIDGILFDDMDGREIRALDLNPIVALQGRHNWQNAAAAYAVCRSVGVPEPVIVACMRTFPGLAHRMEPVALVDGVLFVNDSKATNADAANRSLATYAPIYWIAGGRMKTGGIEACAPNFLRVRHAFLIGECAEAFATTLNGKVGHTRCDTLDNAVTAAFEMAKADGVGGATVLLAPAAASWDQYASFEARGDHFRGLVDALPGDHADLSDPENSTGATASGVQ